MTRSRTPQYSFSSGEISPLLFSRPDYQRNQSGLRSCNGYIPLRQGGATRAPGTKFLGYTRNNAKARLINFEFAENDALTLEFTNLRMRVWRYGELVMNGASPFELVTPYSEAVLDDLWWVQSADVIYLADGVQPIQKLSRFALDDWSIEDAQYDAGPFRVQNLDETKTLQCSAASGSITLAGTGNIFDASWVGVLIQLKPVDFTALPLWTGNTAISVGDLMRYGDNIYELTAGTDTGVNPPIHAEGDQLVDREKGTRWLHISDTSGIVRVTAVANANSASADVVKSIPQPCITSATYRWSEGAWSDRHGYPRTVEIFDQSFFAAFNTAEPRGIWASTLGDFNDFEPSIDADGAFAYTISGSDTQNSGTWLRRARRGIYIGALGEVIRGFSNASGQRIGPTTFDTSVEGTDGSRPVRPITPYGYPVFVTKDGARLEEIRYSFEEDGGKPVELSLPSQHLGAKGFEEIVWQSSPQRLAWIRRGSGDLVVMLYDPDEQVLGWARCSLAGGFVESLSISSSEDSKTDILTMIVRRTIDGQTVRMIEEQSVIYGIIAGFQPIAETNHFFAASQFTSDPATDTFSVPHLVGETVHAWTDKGEYGPYDVPASGEVVLEAEVSRASIGLLDETHEFELLDIPAPARDGSTIGRKKRLHAGSGIILRKTAAGRVSTIERNFAQPDTVNRSEELVPLQVAADLVNGYDGVMRLEANSGYADEVSLLFKPTGGAPMTVMAVIPHVEEANA
ncbi:hypothetical protein K3758_07475 [Sulfitobacter sp. W002]|uniref:hypothetical protein n=1 Tax=Sulfitobacter sp. W002 TaxID=2867024 RepID=UPI0021A58C22|nr:hypothetical protein [Sulfitobacter sp. W002]UWR31334.1 hypothetical protein K3758_07475 [Sulfitobacter sp. W002]